MVQFTRIVSTVDSHTAGEPTRLVVGGLPSLQGVTMAEKMVYARNELDGLRRLLLLEPRGRQDMYGAILTTSADPRADFGLIFMNTRQYTTMCGHAVIGAATTVVETGMVEAVEPETTVTFDTPVGLVHTRIHIEEGRVREVSFDNTPFFVYQLDAHLTVPGLGEVAADIVYSGGFFALVKAQQTRLELVPGNAEALIDLGIQVRGAANSQLSVRHPELPFVNIVDAIEFHGSAERQADGVLCARSAVIFGERTIDRSPCGTGTGARMAVLHAKGELKVGERFVSESIIGTRFTGQVVRETCVGEYPAIVPQVDGRAYLTGLHQFVLDPDDPFPWGFSLTDFDARESVS
jgi:proline racemase